MLMVIAVTFGAFWIWRVVGRKLATKRRQHSGTPYQVLAIVAYLAGAFVGSSLTNALPPVFPEYPALSVLLATTVLPASCGIVCGFAIWGVVALLPVAPPTLRDRRATHNPFDGPTE